MAKEIDVQLAPPANWQDFEVLCWELWMRIWNDANAQRFGRGGQRQDGIDIVGYSASQHRVEAVQCKLKTRGRTKLSMREIREWVKKAEDSDLGFEHLTFATTAPRVAVAQSFVLRLDAERRRRGAFGVSLFAWEDISERLHLYPDLLARYSRSPARRLTLPPPKLPPHYQARPAELAAIKMRLLAPTAGQPRIAGQGMVGLAGMGGVGKSVLAAVVASDAEIQSAFPDGVLWLTLGQAPHLVDLLRAVTLALSDEPPNFIDPKEGKNAVAGLLEGKRALVVLDDVWTLHHLWLLDVVSGESRMLITTRQLDVIQRLGLEEHKVGVLAPGEAAALLAGWTGDRVENLPNEASSIAKECGYLPLALAMVGAMVRLRPATAWKDVLERLRSEDLDAIHEEFPHYPYSTLRKVIEVSVNCLEPWQRERYFELAVFRDDVPIPEPALVTFWSEAGLDAYQSRDLIAVIVARSLAQLDRGGRIELHDLQRDYLRRQVSDMRSLHLRLVEAYRAACPDGFSTGPRDGYFFRCLPYHLAQLEDRGQLRDLLLDFAWMEAKLDATGPLDLASDYLFATGEREMQALGSALQLSSLALSGDKRQLPSQLLGRLSPEAYPSLRNLLATVKRRADIIPLKPSLTSPNDFLDWSIHAHDEAVTRVAASPDGNWIASSTDAGDVKLWRRTGDHIDSIDAVRGTPVSGLTFLRDGKFALSQDGTISLWHTSSRKRLLTLRLDGTITALAASRDGSLIAAASDKGLVQVFDSATGDIRHSHKLSRCLTATGIAFGKGDSILYATCRDHLVAKALDRDFDTEAYYGTFCFGNIAVDDHRHVVISAGEQIAAWEMDSLTQLGEWPVAEYREVVGLALLGDSSIAVVASEEGYLYGVDTASGQPVFRFNGSARSISSIASLGSTERRLLVGTSSGTIQLWRFDEGGVLPAEPDHPDGYCSLGADRFRRRFISASGIGLKLWEPVLEPDGELSLAVQEQPSPIWPATFLERAQSGDVTPDGSRAVVLASSGSLFVPATTSVHVWNSDTDSWTPFASVGNYNHLINWVQISAGGRYVVASWPYGAICWNVDTKEQLDVDDAIRAAFAKDVVRGQPEESIVAFRECTVEVRELTNPGVLHRFTLDHKPIQAGVLMLDDRVAVAIADRGGFVHLLAGHR